MFYSFAKKMLLFFRITPISFNIFSCLKISLEIGQESYCKYIFASVRNEREVAKNKSGSKLSSFKENIFLFQLVALPLIFLSLPSRGHVVKNLPLF